MSKEIPCLVVDHGSGFLKAGLALEEMNVNLIPSVIGRNRENGSVEQYGADASRRSDFLDLSYPIKNGLIEKWDDYTNLMNYAISKELKLDNVNFSFIGSKVADEKVETQLKTIEYFMEEIKVPSYISIDKEILATYGVGLTTALIVDLGEDQSTATPIIEGANHPHFSRTLNYGGRNMTDEYFELFKSRGYKITLDETRKAKEAKSYFSSNYEENLKQIRESTYDLPDGSNIILKEEVFTIPENLFKPYMKGSFTPGIHRLVEEVALNYDFVLKRNLLVNVCLIGGVAQTTNLETRLIEDIKSVFARSLNIHSAPIEYRQSAGWMGGSIVSALSTFKNHWIEKEDYDEYGPNICLRKCF